MPARQDSIAGTETLVSGVQNANGSSVWTGFGPVRDMILQLEVTAKSGTTPTLDVVIEHSVDGTNYFALSPAVAFTQVVGGTALPFRELKSVPSTTPFADYIRVRWTIGGTATPTWTFSVLCFSQTPTA